MFAAYGAHKALVLWRECVLYMCACVCTCMCACLCMSVCHIELYRPLLSFSA